MKPGWLATVLAVLLCLLVRPVNAHPHLWVIMRAEIVFAPDGAIVALRQAWAFDGALSASVAREAGSTPLTRDGLAPLAQVNIDALKESDFFVRSWADGQEQKFRAPEDYWLAFEDGILILRFTLPFQSPPKPTKFELEVYDPAYFIDIKLAETLPVVLAGAPGHCALSIDRQTWTQIANKVVVTCR